MLIICERRLCGKRSVARNNIVGPQGDVSEHGVAATYNRTERIFHRVRIAQELYIHPVELHRRFGRVRT